MDQEDVSTSDVLEHPDEEIALGESQLLARAQLAVEVLRDGFTEVMARGTRQENEVVRHTAKSTCRPSRVDSAAQHPI